MIARVLVFALSLAAGGALAAEDFASFLSGVRAEAAARGVRAAILDQALADLAPIPRVIELDRRQPEGTMSFARYRAGVVNERRIEDGRIMAQRHRALLSEIGRRHGVQPRFLVALWGIETSYGRGQGGYPVVAALATLAHDGRRAAFFRNELLDALTILDQGHVAPTRMIGSWAGAMGQNQFMPSSFLRFALDGDGDGRRDIWNNLADVMASSANYLKQSGWNEQQTWGRTVSLPAGIDAARIGLEHRAPLSEWQRLGIKRGDGSPLPVRAIDASLIRPDGSSGPAFLVYDNFRVLLKWNRSSYFAAAVGELADRIGDR
ncbi:MAG: lytic murein transglycosylase [Alphaproteobacteria bacterium]|nr:lytic murein transglycosylase [Alphaproteobacteria bacterium]